MKQRNIFLLGFLLMAGAGYAAWSYVVVPHGRQKVSFKAAKKECFAGGKRVPWRSCIYTAEQGTNGDVAYFLHGRGQHEDTWNDDDYYTAQIQSQWAKRKSLPPKIISFSFGPVWVLAPKSTAPASGNLEIFLNEFMPEAERRVGRPKSRIIFGDSMGGLNSLLVALRAGELFKKAIVLCPPIYQITPFSPWSTLWEFLKRTGADPRIIYGLIGLAKEYAVSEAEWRGISPLDLARSAKSVPELYLSAGLYDKYGNFEGAQRFAEIAKELGLRLTWRPLYGGHCAVDVLSVAELLAR